MQPAGRCPLAILLTVHPSAILLPWAITWDIDQEIRSMLPQQIPSSCFWANLHTQPQQCKRSSCTSYRPLRYPLYLLLNLRLLSNATLHLLCWELESCHTTVILQFAQLPVLEGFPHVLWFYHSPEACIVSCLSFHVHVLVGWCTIQGVPYLLP